MTDFELYIVSEAYAEYGGLTATSINDIDNDDYDVTEYITTVENDDVISIGLSSSLLDGNGSDGSVGVDDSMDQDDEDLITAFHSRCSSILWRNTTVESGAGTSAAMTAREVSVNCSVRISCDSISDRISTATTSSSSSSGIVIIIRKTVKRHSPVLSIYLPLQNQILTPQSSILLANLLIS